MSRKPKFKPEISRVKLNPEQAVLACDCYSAGKQSGYIDWVGTVALHTACQYGTKTHIPFVMFGWTSGTLHAAEHSDYHTFTASS